MSQKANNLIDRLKSELSIKKDKDLCLLLGIKHNTLSTWKKRDTLDFNKILELCEKHNLDLNYIFFKEEENEEKQQPLGDNTPLIAELKATSKTKINHFFSTQLVNTNRNISIFYNQVTEGGKNISGEIIIGQKVSIKKIDENNLYIIENRANKFYLDKVFIIKDQNLKSLMVHLREANEKIDLLSIVSIWQILDRSTNFLKFIDVLTPV